MLLARINVYRNYLKIVKYSTYVACDLSVSGAFAFYDACRQVLTFYEIVHVCGRVEHILLFLHGDNKIMKYRARDLVLKT